MTTTWGLRFCALTQVGALFLFLGNEMEYTKEQLSEINIYYLRNIAREIGVRAPTCLTKTNLINEILKINSGKKEPTKPNKAGRPIKKAFNVEDLENEEKCLQKKKELIDEILKEIEKKLYELL